MILRWQNMWQKTEITISYYSTSMCVFVYGCISQLIEQRPQAHVSWVCMFICVLCHITLINFNNLSKINIPLSTICATGRVALSMSVWNRHQRRVDSFKNECSSVCTCMWCKHMYKVIITTVNVRKLYLTMIGNVLFLFLLHIFFS